ncbi:MAG: DNA double-strand break repair nuclease NurA [Candidatus Omnitrophica bacterium]|nr:DNA double-strand break repair nuclease NurA [Candidatus Omnitrophota bacterium]MCG2705334.1 DNA double-strand break repair nuclease NurA [Candidatus Omnitrophota bacterium]
MTTLNRLILHPDFKFTIEELGKKNIFLPRTGLEQSLEFLSGSSGNEKVCNLEKIQGYRLDAARGCHVNNEFSISAYDESFMQYKALEGAAHFTSHSLVVHGEREYLPVNLVTFYFYTRSKSITGKSKYIKFVNDISLEAARDYVIDKRDFLLQYVPARSLLFIDGPLIAGDLYTYMVDAIKRFLEKEIIAVFVAKNSLSSLVTENISELRGQYNSDFHWLHATLKRGERSCFFKYEDQVNKKNAKAFCYIKAFDFSPQRIEFHADTYAKYSDSIPAIIDLIYYLLLVQGSKTNPQMRPIAIAEKYARETLKFVNVHKYMKDSNIIPTMNQVRFGG